MFGKLMLAAIAALTLAQAASAAVITRTYAFTATGFNSALGNAAPPFAVVTGSVTLTFDTSATVLDRPGVAATLSIPFQNPVSFSYFSVDDTLTMTSANYSPLLNSTNVDGFGLTIRNAANTPLSGVFNYAVAGTNDRFSTRTVVFAAAPAVGGVPEPATWAMLVLGFAAIGWVARRHQRRAEALFTQRMQRIAAGEIDA